MELFFKALAVILGGVAAYFLWQGNKDGGFVAAVLGAVAFFLSVRFQVKERNREREEERELRREEEEAAAAAEDFDEALRLNETPAAAGFDETNRTTPRESGTTGSERL